MPVSPTNQHSRGPNDSSQWPVLLPATPHIRETFVILRDQTGSHFAIRSTSGGQVLDLTREEGFLFEQIRTNGVQATMQSYFGSPGGTKSLATTVQFILRLQKSGLLEPLANPDLMTSITRLAGKSAHGSLKQNSEQPDFRKKISAVALKSVGHPAASLLVFLSLALVILSPTFQNSLNTDVIVRLLRSPTITLVTLWLSVLTASTIHSLVAGYMTLGAMAPALRTPLKISFTRRGLLFLVADFDINLVDMLSRKDELRLRATFLALPWVAAGLFAIAGGATDTTMITVALAFAIQGLLETTPLERRQLTGFLEAYSRRHDLLESSREFLSKGLLRFDQKISLAESIVATTMIAWMAMLAVYGSSILTSAIYDLANTAASIVNADRTLGSVIDAASSLLWIMMITVVTAGGLFRLIAIPFQNVASLAALPLRALRPKALMNVNSQLTPQSLIGILRNLPLFSGTTDPVLLGVIHKNCRIWQTAPGEAIVKEGDRGTECHLILDGDFIVQSKTPEGGMQTIQQLLAGDLFGEIALLKKKNRNATVTSRGRGVLLSINQEGFDTLFPEKSQLRGNLTTIIRTIKLLQESDALSYLTPTQTLGVANAVQIRDFKAGENLINEGDTNAACAYLIDSGSIRVSIGGTTIVEGRSRGTLIGTTALISDTPRTATVTAESNVVCFEISRKDFLDVCRNNAVIAMILGNETVKQEQEKMEIVRAHQHSSQGVA